MKGCSILFVTSPYMKLEVKSWNTSSMRECFKWNYVWSLPTLMPPVFVFIMHIMHVTVLVGWTPWTVYRFPIHRRLGLTGTSNKRGRKITLHFICTVGPAATCSSTCNLWDPRHVNHHLRQGEIILPCSVIFSAQSISIYHSNSHSVYVYRQGLLTVSAGIHWRLTGTFSWHAIMPSISVFSIACSSVLKYELCNHHQTNL